MDLYQISEWRKLRLQNLADEKYSGNKAALGRALGYKDGAFVGHMIRGERPITEKTIEQVHRVPGCSRWFINLFDDSFHLGEIPNNLFNKKLGIQEGSDVHANVELRAKTSGNIPLISWVRAGEFCEAPDNFATGDADEFLPRPLQNMGKHVFALTVRGDSMDTTDGYREGEIVYVDPDKAPVSGQDVVARVDNKLNLKRYKEDQDGPYLLQLNGNIIIRPQGDWSVCGVVVFSGKRR